MKPPITTRHAVITNDHAVITNRHAVITKRHAVITNYHAVVTPWSRIVKTSPQIYRWIDWRRVGPISNLLVDRLETWLRSSLMTPSGHWRRDPIHPSWPLQVIGDGNPFIHHDPFRSLETRPPLREWLQRVIGDYLWILQFSFELLFTILDHT